MPTTGTIAGREAPELTDRLLKLPPFKAVAARILHVDCEACDAVQQVVGLIRSDPAFASEVLHFANSALFGFSSDVHSVEHATTLVGLNRIRMLALRVATEAFLRSGLQDPVVQRCWAHSVACAELAERLAKMCIVSTDRAYMAGLLHDIGRLALLKACSAEYVPLLMAQYDTRGQSLTAEKSLFRFDHCATGALLTRVWSFPAYFSMIAERHHDNIPHDTDLLGLVQLACKLANCLGFAAIEVKEKRTYEEEIADFPAELRSELKGLEGRLERETRDKILMLTK